nr:hypothetical protein [Chloroflexota bacterium]
MTLVRAWVTIRNMETKIRPNSGAALLRRLMLVRHFGRAIVTLVTTLSIACSSPLSSPPSPSSPGASGGSAAPSSAATVRQFDACVIGLPSGWQSSFAGGTTMPEGMHFGLSNPSVVGTSVYGQFNTATSSGIARLDLATGRLEKLVTFAPEVSGTNSIAVSPPWLSWTLGNSKNSVFDWTVSAKNLDTGEVLTLAQSSRPGGFLPGQQPTLALRGTTLAWSQALPGPLTTYSSEVHLFDLGSRTEEILASGRVSAPVYAGNLLIWGERDSAGVYSFKTVDATTLAPTPLPAPLRDPASIIYLSGNRDWFAWSVEGLQELNVWRVGGTERRVYKTPDIKHYFQFMQFTADYLL